MTLSFASFAQIFAQTAAVKPPYCKGLFNCVRQQSDASSPL